MDRTCSPLVAPLLFALSVGGGVGAGCSSGEASPIEIAAVYPLTVRASGGSDLMVEGAGLTPRLLVDARTGAVTSSSDRYSLSVFGLVVDATRVDATHLAFSLPAVGAPGSLPAALLGPRGERVDLPAPLAIVDPGPPAIRALSPDHGPAEGGVPVVVLGSGFAPGVTITIGGAPLREAVVESATTVRGTLPPGQPSATVELRAFPSGATDAFGLKALAFTYDD